MTFGSTIVVLFIFILAGMIVMRPFLVNTKDQKSPGSGSYDSLLAEKERLYASIEDLDLNLELNKISPEEHAQGRDELLYQAARVLKKLDAHPYTSRVKKTPEALSDDQELEKMIAERRKKIKSSQETVCPECGESVAKGDQFCSHCGGQL
jgi:hypothetical protein